MSEPFRVESQRYTLQDWKSKASSCARDHAPCGTVRAIVPVLLDRVGVGVGVGVVVCAVQED